MSNRTYAIVIGVALTALVAVLIASYFLHRLTLSPLAIYLLGFLIVIPGMGALRLLPSYLVFRSSPELQQRMRELRDGDPAPAYAVWTCVVSLAASFALMIVGALLMPGSNPSYAADALLMLWLGLFMYGWLGLIYTSRWVQTHSFAIALAAIAVIGLSAVLLAYFFAQSSSTLPQIVIPVGIGFYGVAMVMTPVFVRFSRAGGLID